MPLLLATGNTSSIGQVQLRAIKSVAFEHLVIETQWMISLVIASQNKKMPNTLAPTTNGRGAQMCVGSRVLEALADSAMAGREVARSPLTELV